MQGNAQISTGYYLPFDTDADVGDFGDLGHSLQWWVSAHPDWILYRCDRRTPARVGGLPDNVPLDISNPAVGAYQMQLVVPFMRANGYTSLTVDVLSLQNGPGGCGIWTHDHTRWVQKFSGQQKDSRYAAAVLAWMSYVQWFLHVQHPQFPMLVNAPGWVTARDPGQEALISHLDGFQDEGGYTGWGNHMVDEASFLNKEWWAQYVQAQGKAYLVTDLWRDSEPNPAERDFSVSTYLMSKAHQAAMVTARYGHYGVEHYWPEFASAIGTPCASMYHDQGVYFRKYTGALVVVNPTGVTASITLPRSARAYADMEGRTVNDPLTLNKDDGFVLLTTSGCN